MGLIGILLGLSCGVGLLLAFSAVRPVSRLERLWLGDGAENNDAAHWRQDHGGDRSRVQEMIGGWVYESSFADLMDNTGLDEDLAITGRDRAAFATDAIAKASVLVAVIAAVAIVTPPSFPLGLDARLMPVLLAGVLFTGLVEVQSIKRQAKLRRREMLDALAAFMEFTKIAAQTQSADGAMRTGVKVGTTWPFAVIERVYAQSDARHEHLGAGLSRLGRTYGMVELIELGGAMESASREGSGPGEMLSAKAQSLRAKATEAEIGAAQARTEQMTIPLSLIGLVVFALLLAPAMLAL